MGFAEINFDLLVLLILLLHADIVDWLAILSLRSNLELVVMELLLINLDAFILGVRMSWSLVGGLFLI